MESMLNALSTIAFKKVQLGLVFGEIKLYLVALPRVMRANITLSVQFGTSSKVSKIESIFNWMLRVH